MLGRRNHTAGNITRYEIDYSQWLSEGESLDTATVVMDPAFTATVTDVTITDVEVTPSRRVVFTLGGGSVSELFTLNIHAVTQNPVEEKNDQIAFTVVAP